MSTAIPTDHLLERARWKARNRVADLLALSGALVLMLPALALGPDLLTWLSALTTTALLLFFASWIATKTARKYESSLTELADHLAAGLRKTRR